MQVVSKTSSLKNILLVYSNLFEIEKRRKERTKSDKEREYFLLNAKTEEQRVQKKETVNMSIAQLKFS